MSIEQLQSLVTRNIRIALAANDMKQKDLANVIGITSASISAKFSGKAHWNLVDIAKASELLHISPEALISVKLSPQLVGPQGLEPWTDGL